MDSEISPRFVESLVEQRIILHNDLDLESRTICDLYREVSSADVVPHVEARFYDILENTSSTAVYKGMLTTSGDFSNRAETV